MRISDWSSDVCSSDLIEDRRRGSGRGIADGDEDDERAVFPRQGGGEAGHKALSPSGEREEPRSGEGREAMSITACKGRTTPSRLVMTSEFVKRTTRAEEHTSELQTLMRSSYAAICLQKQLKYKTTKHTSY